MIKFSIYEYKFRLIIFILFTIILLVEGFYHYYEHRLYKLSYIDDFKILTIQKDQEYKIEQIEKSLVNLRYKKISDQNILRGTFRIRNQYLEIFPSELGRAYRLSFFENKIDKIEEFSPLTGDLITGLYIANVYTVIKTGFNPYIWNENGLVEIIQSLFLFLTIIILINVIKNIKNKISEKLMIYLIYLYFLCILYFFLEEISWGQHIFKWESGSFFLIYNNQGETNIHNISNLFDQLPRGFLFIWCAFPFFIQKFILTITSNKTYSNFVFPDKELKYISLILLLFFSPDFIADKMNLHPGHDFDTNEINRSDIFDFITFQFIKLSEYHELIFTFYLFNHALFFKKLIYSKT